MMNRSLRHAVIAAFLALCVLALSADAANYKYTDGDGVTHFTNNIDSVPKHLLDRVETLYVKKRKRRPPAQKSRLGEAVIPYRESNKTMLINVLAKGFIEEFLFDTGSTNTIVSTSLEKKLGLKKIPGSEMLMQTANGEVETYMVNIDRLRVGSIDMVNVKAAVQDFAAKGVKTTGILGMNVLEKYTFTINPKTKTIHLRPHS